MTDLSNATAEYRECWRRMIFDATGDNSKALRALELADINGLFDPLTEIEQLRETEGLLREQVDNLLAECLRQRDENERLRAIIATISKNWSEGWNGNFSANWKEEDASPGYWLPSANASAIERAMTGDVSGHEQKPTV